MKKETLIIYIHGQGGNADEAKHFEKLFPHCDVIGLDYVSATPWDAETELDKLFDNVSENYNHVSIIANSIGAYFAMCALKNKHIDNAFFISPVVDMYKLICNLMNLASITQEELEKRGEIQTAFGQTLTWQYFCYARDNPVSWHIPTHVLYGEKDNLVGSDTIKTFCNKNDATLDVMKGGEHWFHTAEQMDYLDKWALSVIK